MSKSLSVKPGPISWKLSDSRSYSIAEILVTFVFGDGFVTQLSNYAFAIVESHSHSGQSVGFAILDAKATKRKDES